MPEIRASVRPAAGRVHVSFDPATGYGGQAVVEGVMMRGQTTMAVAVRASDGGVMVWSEPLQASRLARQVKDRRFVRGAILLWDTMALGIRALVFSGGMAERAVDPGKTMDVPPRRALWATAALSIILAIGLFFVLPLAVVALVDGMLETAWLSNLIETAIRLLILFGYLIAIGRLPQVQRVFGYHGAEHKAIHAWAAGARLDLDVVRRQPLPHPRCGTGFLLVVIALSTVVFILMGRPELPLRLLSRIMVVPVVAGVAFELLKFAARRAERGIWQLVLAPGLWLQRFTTREPDDSMLTVAIVALTHVLRADGRAVSVDPGLPEPATVDERGRAVTLPWPWARLEAAAD